MQVERLLIAFEGQLDLPPQPIEGHGALGATLRRRERREEEDVAGGLPGGVVTDFAVVAGLPLHAGARLRRLGGRQGRNDELPGYRRRLPRGHGRHGLGLARAGGHRATHGQQIEGDTVRGLEQQAAFPREAL